MGQAITPDKREQRNSGAKGTQAESTPEATQDQVTREETPARSEDEPERGLPLDVTFEVLKNERRRLVLAHLREADESVTIGELAERIAAYENGISRAELNAQQRKRVYIGLYQCHLPKMADADVVEFNQDRGVVRLGENAPELLEYLDAEDETDEPKIGYYGGLAIVGGTSFALARAFGAAVFADLVVLALILAIPLLAYYVERST